MSSTVTIELRDVIFADFNAKTAVASITLAPCDNLDWKAYQDMLRNAGLSEAGVEEASSGLIRVFVLDALRQRIIR